MEMLFVPSEPTFPVPRTRLVGDERWDCGLFLSYANRKDVLRRVPHGLRHGGPAPEVSYLELIYPTPQAENESFYLTWFLFGLVAECMDLNEGPDGTAAMERDAARSGCDAIYDHCVVEDDGERYVDGEKVLELLVPFLTALADGKDEVVSRLGHLRACLYLTYQMINVINSEFDDTVRFAIAALGEVLSTAAHTAVTSSDAKKRPVQHSPLGFSLPWHRLFMAEGGEVEALMLAVGWCASEIERIRHSYQGLGSMHFMSRLSRMETGLDHSSCTKALCKAFQIDLSSYKLSHAEKDCQCAEYEVNIQDIQHVLRNSKSYPILRFEKSDDGKVDLAVEEYAPGGVEYIALSHVRHPLLLFLVQ
jgi:hypothetical protein